jgi:prophage antirepressor-like protein
MKILSANFEGQSIRRVYDDATEVWWFSVIDVVQVLTGSANGNRYWSDLKRKLAQEAGSAQPYEKIVRLKLPTTDGKQRPTDCATAQTLLRLVQSIPSPKA